MDVKKIRKLQKLHEWKEQLEPERLDLSNKRMSTENGDDNNGNSVARLEELRNNLGNLRNKYQYT